VLREALPKLFGGRKRGVIATDAAGELRPIPFTSAADVLLGDGTFGSAGAAAIANDSVTNAKLANMAQSTIKGRAAGAGTGDPTDLTPAQVRTVLGLRKTATVTFDGGGAAIVAGAHAWCRVDMACTIVGVSLLADQDGDFEVDIYKDTFANYPPTGADSIVASAPPTLSGADSSEDTTLTGWTTALAAGDVLIFEVTNCVDIEKCVLSLVVSY
jgi:hypothetical protein